MLKGDIEYKIHGQAKLEILLYFIRPGPCVFLGQQSINANTLGASITFTVQPSILKPRWVTRSPKICWFSCPLTLSATPQLTYPLAHWLIQLDALFYPLRSFLTQTRNRCAANSPPCSEHIGASRTATPLCVATSNTSSYSCSTLLAFVFLKKHVFKISCRWLDKILENKIGPVGSQRHVFYCAGLWGLKWKG